MWQLIALRQADRADRHVVTRTPIAGGCISETAIWTLDNGQRLFAKTESLERYGLLEAEADGLRALANSNTIRVPRVWAVGAVPESHVAFLLSEFIETSSASQASYEALGRQLAALHRQSPQQNGFGWHRDNFIGSTPQPNAMRHQWSEFFAELRLGYQLRLAVDQRRATKRLQDAVEKIIGGLHPLLVVSPEPPALLHGDLWSGNFLTDSRQRPVLIDPAVYQGDREAEFGMLELFGNCPPVFYDAYHATYPLRDGWRERAELYMLYHVLNHLNLFGGSYSEQCERLAVRIAARL